MKNQNLGIIGNGFVKELKLSFSSIFNNTDFVSELSKEFGPTRIVGSFDLKMKK